MAHHDVRQIEKIAHGVMSKIITLVSMLVLIAGILMLLKVTYFKTAELTVVQLKSEISVFERIRVEEDKLKRVHFHNVDKTLKVEDKMPTLCLRCHGNYPHRRAKEIRAMLNFHTFFCACEVCHFREKPGVLTFKWYDNESGAIISKLKGKDGNYGAKIVPRMFEDDKYVRLDKPTTETYAQDFMKVWFQYTYDQQAKAKAELHKGLADKPIQCIECHRKEEPVLDFRDLGYSDHWVDELTGTEVAGMIDKYMTFYLPTMFNPDEVRREREELLRLRKLEAQRKAGRR